MLKGGVTGLKINRLKIEPVKPTETILVNVLRPFFGTGNQILLIFPLFISVIHD
jgi:hypothetical protein